MSAASGDGQDGAPEQTTAAPAAPSPAGPPPAGAPDGPADAPAPAAARASALRQPATLIIIGMTLLALAVRLYYFTRPGYLLGVTEYDDGSYFGSAVRLVHGVLPYRDFVFVQPPGITLLMTPVALISELTGTGVGMVLGRLLTVLAGTAGIAMTGLLVRHRGVLAVLLASGIMAIHPESIAAAHTILVEPWLVLFCLAGALAFFRRDRVSRSGGRLVVAGLAFGFAGVIEAWAIVPVVVLLAILAPQPRRALAFAVAVAAGFGIPTVPFAALAPTSFYQSIIVAQVGSRPSAERVFGLFRIRLMVGLSDIISPANALVIGTTLAVIGLVLAGAVVACRAERRLPAPLEWFAAATAGIMALLFLWPPQFHYHFVAFLVPFMAISIALAASGLMGVLRERAGEARAAAAWGGSGKRHGIARPQLSRLLGGRDPQEALRWGASVLVMIGIVAGSVIQVSYERHLASSITPTEIANVQRAIPAGACVLADEVSYSVVANRFWSDRPGCPAIDDGTGVNYALSNGLNTATGAGQVPAVAHLWRSALAHSQYVWLSFHQVKRIPWTPAITAYFHRHYVRIPHLGLDITAYKWVPSGGTATVP